MVINSYHQLRTELEKLGCLHPNCGSWLYRGLSDENFKLIPSIYRPPQPFLPKRFERKILTRFIKRNVSKAVLSSNGKIWNNAFLARHFGLRSRMLDWTIDLSAALYFMHGEKSYVHNADLYLMSTDFIKMENSSSVYEESYFDFNPTIVLNPSFHAEDLAVIASKNRFIQYGRFLIQDYKNARLDFYEQNKKNVTKLKMSRASLQNIYTDCCLDFGNDPNIGLVLGNDPSYEFCKSLNKGKNCFGYIF